MKRYHVFGQYPDGLTSTRVHEESFDTLLGAKAYANFQRNMIDDKKIKIVIQEYFEKENAFDTVEEL